MNTKFLSSKFAVFMLAASCFAITTSAHADIVPSSLALFAPELDGKLNVNTASATQWELLPGIGEATAQRILEYRQKAPFKDLTHLMRVKGIGRKTFDRIKPYLVLQGDTTLQGSGGTAATKSGKSASPPQ